MSEPNNTRYITSQRDLKLRDDKKAFIANLQTALKAQIAAGQTLIKVGATHA